jgi:hypothetical protein
MGLSIKDQLKKVKEDLAKSKTEQSNRSPMVSGSGPKPAAQPKMPDQQSVTKSVDGQQVTVIRTAGKVAGAKPVPTLVTGTSAALADGKSPMQNNVNADSADARAQLHAHIVNRIVPSFAGEARALDQSELRQSWLQSEHRSGQKPKTVSIGLDFGTGYTKACVRFAGKTYVVDWSDAVVTGAFHILPGFVSVFGDGICALGRAPGAVRILKNFKHPLLLEAATPADEQKASVFLALVLRYIRLWVNKTLGLQIGRAPVYWELTMGAPARQAQDARILDAIRRVGTVAWIASVAEGPITEGGVAAHSARPVPAGLEQTVFIDVAPEFVAQIACYTQSPQKQPGLHLLVDVGAGTLDAVTFNVWPDDLHGGDKFPIFMSDVAPLGAHYALARRFSKLPHTMIPDAIDDGLGAMKVDEFSRAIACEPGLVEPQDALHSWDAALLINRVVYRTKQNRYRRSLAWETQLRTFFCGGGSRGTTFQRALEEASRMRKLPFDRAYLPVPSDSEIEFGNVSHEEFDRVSVAFGLAFGRDTLGNIVFEDAIEDDRATTPLADALSRDELYAR